MPTGTAALMTSYLQARPVHDFCPFPLTSADCGTGSSPLGSSSAERNVFSRGSDMLEYLMMGGVGGVSMAGGWATSDALYTCGIGP